MRDPQRLTRIVATIGPASDSLERLRQLVAAGMDVARLNASHGDHAYFRMVVDRVREIAGEAGRELAILMDLRGPKIRVGKLAGGGPVRLEEGAVVTITTEDIEGDATRVPCTYKGLPGDVEAGDTILLDDGILELRVEAIEGKTELRCTVVVGGLLKPNKGINVPGRALSAPAFGAKDLRDLESAIELGCDYLALSFVRSAQDVNALRKEMHKRGGLMPIISKIEKPQALDELEDILDASEGIMVARGDLGVEIPPERVPSIQKRLIRKANERGIPVITATQMLESMVENPRPTRAEASDVANAIFDGTDAVMLSGETAAGKYPVKAVEMMRRIAAEAEQSTYYKGQFQEGDLTRYQPHIRAMAWSAQKIASVMDAKLIVVYTLGGTTARVMSKLQTGRRIAAICPDPVVCRQLVLLHGVTPLRLSYQRGTDEMLRAGDQLLLESGMAEEGETVVVVGGTRQFPGATNMVQLRQLRGDGGFARD